MKKIGSYMAIAGLLSIVLNLVGYNLKILLWIDSWGSITGWIIRAGILLLGLLLLFAGGSSPSVSKEEQ